MTTTIKHEELSLEDLRLVGGGCHKKHSAHSCPQTAQNGQNGLTISIHINGGAGDSAFSSIADATTVPYVGAVPGSLSVTTTPGAAATTSTTTTSLPGADTVQHAPASAGLGTALPGA